MSALTSTPTPSSRVTTALPPITAPREPQQGQRFWVVWGSRISMGDSHSVSRVNRRSFYTSHRGETRRHLRSTWAAWLAARFAEGQVFLDGREVQVPDWLPVDPLRQPPTGRESSAGGALHTAIPTRPEGHTYAELRTLLLASVRADLPVFVRGAPGLGKSALVREVAAALDLPVIDLRLAHIDPVELGGARFPDRDSQQLRCFVPPWLARAAAAPALLFLDELNAATSAPHQSIAYQLVLERRLGETALHPGVRVVAAGNLSDDLALARPLSSALANRMVHLRLGVDLDGWLRWAAQQGVHPAVRAFLSSEGAGALCGQPTLDEPWPSPRSWAMAGQLLQSAEAACAEPLVAAVVGPAAAARFLSFWRSWRRFDPDALLDGVDGAFSSLHGLCAEPGAACEVMRMLGRRLVQRFGAAPPNALDPAAPNTTKTLRRFVHAVQSDILDPEHRVLALQPLLAEPALLEALSDVPGFAALSREVDLLAADER